MAHVQLLLVDACVLIDFVKADASVLTLTSRHVGEVHVASPVFEEVRDLDIANAASLGIKVFEPTLDMIAEAATTRGRLSFQDRLCVLVAKDRGWTCVSNDKQLRATCAAEDVPIMWGFEVLVQLVKKRALTPIAARDLATRIANDNKRIGRQVVARFLARIGVKD